MVEVEGPEDESYWEEEYPKEAGPYGTVPDMKDWVGGVGVVTRPPTKSSIFSFIEFKVVVGVAFSAASSHLEGAVARKNLSLSR